MSPLVVKIPGWLADTLMSDHIANCSHCAAQRWCLITTTLKDAIGTAIRQEQAQAHEWRTKGFPRDP